MLISWPHPNLAKVILTKGEEIKLSLELLLLFLLYKRRYTESWDTKWLDGAILIPSEEVMFEVT